jgi:LysM domain
MSRRMNRTVLVFTLVLLPLMFSVSSLAAGKKEVIKSETGFYYTVQKGDTLWDLSKHFSDSPWLWPELWKENDQISNPHWIFPGERIRLYQKSGSQTVTQAKPSRPVETASAKPAAEKKAIGPYFLYSSIDSLGFIRKPPVAPSGTIFAVKDGKVLISQGDLVYIHPDANATQSDFIPGSQYTVFKYMKPTDARDSRKTIGTQHYILGIVQVTEKASGLVLAKVLKSFHAIHVDDLLMPYHRHHEKIELRPSTPGIDGKIICAVNHTELSGDDMLVFINKGRADHIQVGQQYSIYRRQAVHPGGNQQNTVLLPPYDFGSLLVLHTEKTTSTVIITRSESKVVPGESFRTPVE